MIIDDLHRVVFVHIPKCGGTSVRRPLRTLDSLDGAFNRPIDHPKLGPVHLAHLPLCFLRDCYPQAYAKVVAYRSFALTREPHARFASATFQRLKEFKGLAPLETTARRALDEAREVMDWLKGRDAFCDLEYIHFSRQVDFVDLDGRRIVDEVFPLDDMAVLGETLERLCGVRLDPAERENANFATSNGLLTAMRRYTKPIYSRITPWSFRERVLRFLRRSRLHNPEGLYAAFRRDARISEFVETFYADDFALYRAAQARVIQAAGSPPLAQTVSPP